MPMERAPFGRPLHNTPSAASLSRFGLGHVRKHTPFALTLSSLHLGHSAKSLPKKRCFFGERPFCKGLIANIVIINYLANGPEGILREHVAKLIYNKRECCTKCHSRTFVSNVLRLCTKDEMQGAEDEVEGSVLTYVTETEFRKQRSRSPSCNSLM